MIQSVKLETNISLYTVVHHS